MASQITRLTPLTRLSHIIRWRKPRVLTSHLSKRHVQEFPQTKYHNVQPNDYVLVLPEPINETPQTNELLRIPRLGEPELNFSKLNMESIFKGLSQVLCSFENYLTDVNNMDTISDKTINEFFKDIEQNLFPLDAAFNILMIILHVGGPKLDTPEFHRLITRYYSIRDARFEGNFKYSIQNYALSYDKLSDIDKKMLKFYYPANPAQASLRVVDEITLSSYRKQLASLTHLFRENLDGATRLFSHTVDDPDILAVVNSEFQDSLDLHHKDRTPLKITASTYHQFMKCCPDRFVRQMLWQTRNKRCSPKALPKYNNISNISTIRVLRRKIADILGYRTHLEYRLDNAMAKSRQQILDTIRFLKEENEPNMSAKLYELNEFAADNQFEDTNQLGIQDYDVEFWVNKYRHDVLIGKGEAELKSFFPLPIVMKGLYNYFKDYFGLEIKKKSKTDSSFWSDDVDLLEVSKDSQPLGHIMFDPYHRADKRAAGLFYGRVRGRSSVLDSAPTRLISTSFKKDPASGQVDLSTADIMNLFNIFATVLQRLLYKYEYYELNIPGALEVDANNLLPNFCIAHLLSDHRILQSCSARGGSKPIDSELASRILKSITYFRPLETWRELYLAHLDLEMHSGLVDTKNLVQELYPKYSPFQRDPDDYEFCSLVDIIAGSNAGTQYANLWSKQLANFCQTGLLAQNSSDELASLELEKIRNFNSQLVDTLFDPEKVNTQEKLLSLVKQSFEPTRTGLGVL